RFDSIQFQQGVAGLDLTDLAPHCQRWSGVARDPTGSPVANQWIQLDAPSQQIVAWARSRAGGRFDLPLVEDGSISFEAPFGGNSLRSVHRSSRARGSYEEDMSLRDLQWGAPLQPHEDAPQLVYGDAADGRRFNILFIAEGYV